MLTQINLVVRDLELSHVFYTTLGWTMRAITFPGSDEPQAWLTVTGPAPLTLHSQSFAGWWDSSRPQPAPAATTLDLTFERESEASRFIQAVVQAGGTVLAESRPMPWGQNYAIVTDLDGYRWGASPPRAR